MDLKNERNFMETAKSLVVKWTGNQIQHTNGAPPGDGIIETVNAELAPQSPSLTEHAAPKPDESEAQVLRRAFHGRNPRNATCP